MTSPATSRGRDDKRLRLAAVLFVVAYVIHGADHLRRGFGVLTDAVFWGGNLQGVLGLATVILVLAGHRWAPAAAVAVGFGSAAGFVAVHFLPDWGAFSDSFVTGDVIWFSWAAASIEVAADLFLGYAGLRVLRRAGLVPLRPPAGGPAGETP